MVSINTNVAALNAMNTGRLASQSLNRTQDEVSSGLRVGRASDNAAYWSIATTMRSHNQTMQAVQDSLGLGAAVADTAYMGMTETLEVMQEVKRKLVIAREPGVDRNKINLELDELRAEASNIVYASSFAGENWLLRTDPVDDADQQIVGSVTDNGKAAVTTLDFSRAAPLGTNHLIDEIYHNGILTNVEYARNLGAATEWVFMNGRYHGIHTEFSLTSSTTNQDIDEMIGVTEAMITDMTDAAANLGALSNRIKMQDTFVGDLRNSLSHGIGRLVDADMTDTSAQLKARQTQVQLTNQALNIANTQAGNILKLFTSQ